MTVWKMSFKILEEFQNTNNNSHLLARERILRFRRIGVQKRMAARPVVTNTTILHTSNRGGRREQLYNHPSPTHTMIFVLKAHLPKFSTAFFGVSKTCRTRVEPRSVGFVLHSLENLRRKRVQLTRIAGDFTVDTLSLSDKRGESTKSQVSCFKGFALTENSPGNKGLPVREFLEWWRRRELNPGPTKTSRRPLHA